MSEIPVAGAREERTLALGDHSYRIRAATIYDRALVRRGVRERGGYQVTVEDLRGAFRAVAGEIAAQTDEEAALQSLKALDDLEALEAEDDRVLGPGPERDALDEKLAAARVKTALVEQVLKDQSPDYRHLSAAYDYYNEVSAIEAVRVMLCEFTAGDVVYRAGPHGLDIHDLDAIPDEHFPIVARTATAMLRPSRETAKK